MRRHFIPHILSFALAGMSAAMPHAQAQSLFDWLKPNPPVPAPANPPEKPPAPKRPKPAAPAPTTNAPTQVEAPYEGQLLRLSEILGSLTYLRDLCGAQDGEQFRAQMNALLEAESAQESRRTRLAGAFNTGFTNYETVYRACTPNAQNVMKNYLDEGNALAHDISSRYGG